MMVYWISFLSNFPKRKAHKWLRDMIPARLVFVFLFMCFSSPTSAENFWDELTDSFSQEKTEEVIETTKEVTETLKKTKKSVDTLLHFYPIHKVYFHLGLLQTPHNNAKSKLMGINGFSYQYSPSSENFFSVNVDIPSFKDREERTQQHFLSLLGLGKRWFFEERAVVLQGFLGSSYLSQKDEQSFVGGGELLLEHTLESWFVFYGMRLLVGESAEQNHGTSQILIGIGKEI